jgi:hypothetical protein
MNNRERPKQLASSLLRNEEDDQDYEISTFICEVTDGILDPLDQMTYALNEIQLKYGGIVVLRDAP